MSRGKRTFAVLQKVGQSLMIPVSVLPAAGLMVAIGRLLENFADGKSEGALHTATATLGKIFFTGGISVFEQLPVIFAVGVAIGFTGGAGVAGLSAVAGYFTLKNVLKVVTDVRGLELAIDTGVFGGIIIGLVAANLYQRYFQTKLHPVLGFFSGKRLVPIVTVGSAILVAIALGFVWPPIQTQINAFGAYAMNSDFGPALYAAGKRLLIPLGLHHVYYPPFLYQFGQFVSESGKVLMGDSARYFGGDPTAGRFMAAEFPIMLFGLPAAAFAMYLRAAPHKRAAVAGVMLSAALTSIITGITEPIEFAFIFVAPILFVFHVASAFLSGFLTGMLDIHLGYTFSASLIDYALGFFNQHNSLYLWIAVGPAIAALYFGVFYWAIGALDLATPGREEDESNGVSNVTASNKAVEVLKALGGAGNLLHLDACITRLRLSVKDSAQVNQVRLKEIGAAGILNAGAGNFQVIFGVESDQLKEEIQSLIRSGATTVDQTKVSLRSPLSGKLLDLAHTPDETFAQKIMGDGFAIDPTEGVLYAPMDATVAQIFRTNHAIGLVTDKGVEVLIHIGIDTVKLEGRGFKGLVKNGDKVKAGDKLIEFDLDLVRKEAKSVITPVVFTNMDAIKNWRLLKSGTTRANEPLVEIEI